MASVKQSQCLELQFGLETPSTPLMRYYTYPEQPQHFVVVQGHRPLFPRRPYRSTEARRSVGSSSRSITASASYLVPLTSPWKDIYHTLLSLKSHQTLLQSKSILDSQEKNDASLTSSATRYVVRCSFPPRRPNCAMPMAWICLSKAWNKSVDTRDMQLTFLDL